jgi:hypothetical protein
MAADMISVALSSANGAFDGGRSGGPRTGAARRGAAVSFGEGFGGLDAVADVRGFAARSAAERTNCLGRSTSVA